MSKNGVYKCEKCGFVVPAGDFISVAIMKAHLRKCRDGDDNTSCSYCGEDDCDGHDDPLTHGLNFDTM